MNKSDGFQMIATGRYVNHFRVLFLLPCFYSDNLFKKRLNLFIVRITFFRKTYSRITFGNTWSSTMVPNPISKTVNQMLIWSRR